MHICTSITKFEYNRNWCIKADSLWLYYEYSTLWSITGRVDVLRIKNVPMTSWLEVREETLMFGSIKASLRLNQAHSWRLIQPESVTALTSAREPPCISHMTSANPRPAESLVNQGFLSLRSGPNTRAWHFQVQPPASTDSQTLRSWFCSPGQDKEPNPRKGKQDGPSQTS